MVLANALGTVALRVFILTLYDISIETYWRLLRRGAFVFQLFGVGLVVLGGRAIPLLQFDMR